MIAIPSFEDVLAALGRDPADLAESSAVEPGRGRRVLVRGLAGVGVGLVLCVIGAIGSALWHWIWLVLLATGMLLLAAGLWGVASGIRLSADERRGEGKDLIRQYLAALASALEAANPASEGATRLDLAEEREAPADSLEAVRRSGLFPHATGARVDDLLTGTVLGTPFEIREIAIEHRADYPGGGSGRRIAFDGLLTVVTASERIEGAVQVLDRERGPALRGADVGLAPVPTGDADFDRVFEVAATSPDHAAIIDAPLRERLLRLALDAATDDVALLFEGGHVRCAVADDVDMFEVDEGDLLTQLATVHDELALCLRVVDLLARPGR